MLFHSLTLLKNHLNNNFYFENFYDKNIYVKRYRLGKRLFHIVVPVK